MENHTREKSDQSKSFTLTVYKSCVMIQDEDFGIVLPKSYTISDAIEAFNEAKSAEELFINQFKL